MKGLFKLFEKDIMSENFTQKEMFIYGVIAPLAFIAVCILGSAL